MSKKRKQQKLKQKKTTVSSTIKKKIKWTPRLQLLFQQATTAHQAGDWQKAVEGYQSILKQSPHHADSLHLLGLIKAERGELEGALDLINKAITIQPDFPAYYLNRGLLQRRLGHHDKAVIDYQKALKFDARNPIIYAHLGDDLTSLGQLDEAIAAYQASLEYAPQNSKTHNNLGNAYLAKEDYHAAIACYECVLEKENIPETLSNKGVALVALDKLDEAIQCYEHAATLNPQYAKAYSNWGLALNRKHQYEEAELLYQKALTYAPDDAEIHSNRGINFKDENRIDEALTCFHKALEINPNYPEATFNLSITYLVKGDFIQGWKYYESRFLLKERQHSERTFSQPQWQGESMPHQTLLIHVEQGLGDTLQFIRFIPLVQTQIGNTARIRFECQPALIPLLQSQLPVEFIHRGAPLPPFDKHIAIMSLPHALKTTLDTIPAAEGYLRSLPNSTLSNLIQRRDKAKAIGLIWAGNPQHKNNHNRTMALALFKPLLQLPHIRWYSLQYGEQSKEIAQEGLTEQITDLAPHIKDFADTAALLEQLDGVITIDSAVAHLAGALGKTCWVLLPYAPDFRWLLNRTDTPWYESLTLVRQQKPTDWSTVIQTLIEILSETAAHRGTPTKSQPEKENKCGDNANNTPTKDVEPISLNAPTPTNSSFKINFNTALPLAQTTASHSTQQQKTEQPTIKRVFQKRPNILFSTTINWNPGDNFILLGIQNLLHRCIGSHFNSLVYNRNPEIQQLRCHFNRPISIMKDGKQHPMNVYQTLKPHLFIGDNGWRPKLLLDDIDLVVFAGTPEWLGPMVSPLTEWILTKQIPACYLGIGAFEGIKDLRLPQMSAPDRDCLQQAKLITIRDSLCAKIVAPLTAYQLPCPALLASPTQKPRTQLKRIALSTQGIATNNGQRIHPDLFHYTIDLFKALNQHYDCALVCHYIQELAELKPHLGDEMPFYYTASPEEYLTIYDAFDLTVTTRVHGAGLCASLGIPAFVIQHSTRSETTQGFMTESIQPQQETPENVLARIKAMDINQISITLIAHKLKTLQRYEALLQPMLTELPLTQTVPAVNVQRLPLFPITHNKEEK